jgi:hypothetical protein
LERSKPAFYRSRVGGIVFMDFAYVRKQFIRRNHESEPGEQGRAPAVLQLVREWSGQGQNGDASTPLTLPTEQMAAERYSAENMRDL